MEPKREDQIIGVFALCVAVIVFGGGYLLLLVANGLSG